MTVVIIGTTTWPVRISDAATDAAARYALYLRPEHIKFQTHYVPVSGTDTPLPAGVLFAVSAGTIIECYLFAGHNQLIVATSTDRDNFIKAWDYWHDNDSLLYLTVNDAYGHNLAQFSSYANNKAGTETLEQWQGRLVNLVEDSDSSATFVNQWQLVFNRYTK